MKRWTASVHRMFCHYYEIVWDEEQTHKFKNISPHLQRIKAF
jgi:predicted esterase YcpF (UPF0227 family)